MIRIKNEMLTKGLIAAAIVAVTGVVGGANLVQAQHEDKPSKEQCAASGFRNYGQCVRVWAQDDSGYGNSGQVALAAADDFEEAIAEETDVFTGRVDNLTTTAEKQLTPNGRAATQAFSVRFDEATTEYDQTVADAFADFRAAVTEAAETSESRNQFIDQFNRAKAEYLNSLDAAKNRYASELSNMGHNANVVKDQFMNGFNAARDAYSNQLEAAKNDFAGTVQ